MSNEQWEVKDPSEYLFISSWGQEKVTVFSWPDLSEVWDKSYWIFFFDISLAKKGVERMT